MKPIIAFIATFSCICATAAIVIKPAYAFDFSRQNNKFGIGLAQPHLEDLQKAADLVNSNGGDWGYVTLIIQDNDRNREKWQDIFDHLRQYHLIPIIRIATHPDGQSWQRPKKEDAQSWADFLDSLHWVVKNRYIVLFNEPNHATEWGGTVDAANYAEVAKDFAEKLKAKNPDFFVMLAGLDASAPTSMPQYLDEYYFMQNFFQAVPAGDFERLFDGWASHSYPNQDFSGNPLAAGRGTVRTYVWELGMLKTFGVNKTLPVFITETGWTDKHLSRQDIADDFAAAYQNIWVPDDRVVAVTPFVFDYQSDPFLGFSWKLPSSQVTNDQEFYPQYYTVQSLAKTKGDPEQVDTGKINIDLPTQFVANSSYHFRVRLKNTGQAIWDKNTGYRLSAVSYQNKNQLEYFFSDLKDIKPFEENDVDVYIKTGNNLGKGKITVKLMKDNKTILQTPGLSFDIIPLPSLKFNIQLYPKLVSDGDRFELQIFDDTGGVVLKKKGLHVSNGQGSVEDIQNIIPGKEYRVVLLDPYYLPRQTFIVFQRGENPARFKRMYPLDLDKNGHLDWEDVGELLKHPELMRLFFP